MTEEITPEDLITDNHEFMMHNVRHGSLAPKTAEERWQELQAVVGQIERLTDLYYERAEAASNARADARAAHARSAETGKAAPAGIGAKVLDAELAVDGTLSAVRGALDRLPIVRKAYDALFEDDAFVTEYRKAVSAEFLKRRDVAIKAFQVLEAQVPALAELYTTLGEFTLDHLLWDTVSDIEFNGEKLSNGGVFTKSECSWAAPKLATAISEARRIILSDDPVTGGTLLTENLNTIAAALPELAEQRYEEWQEALAAERMQMRNAGPYGAFSH
ncbi:hypothetical protein [Streptomyces sp. NRRL S-920]|uniref:hypothetical protein n=1 Tax=Streptomyces sp. NRRL S-920 TaxID=1463921 RepID=UPI0004C4AA90|nr:hypothetical protein [Streptomyces sp. NRRL S-920]